jgi:hypothetical protein
LQRGGLFGSKMGSRSFLFIAIFVAQFGSRCRVLLLHIPTNGNDVCGDNKLGSKCRCSCALFIVSS